ncbi:transposon Tf2-6 polyprotein [Trichonephila clavipes]|nr:transposon Tf2-6 polyprotein [Trichonephila clavipes]
MKIVTVNNYEDFYSDFPVSQDILPPLMEKDFNLSGLDSKIKNRLFQLLISHKSAFACSTVELSAAATEHHRISLQHDYPIKCPIYKIPFNLRNEFRRQIADLEKAGIISKSNSHYNTPALFVKQTEKWCLVLDFRKLNEITLTQDFVIPTLDDILHEISGSNYFSALDMKSAFNQIPLHFADRHKTAFSTPDGCCNFYRRYIKRFAKRALPLTNLLRKDTPFEWTSETQEAFEDIKKAILNPSVLALPDPNAELQITTDASSRGIGAVLEQKYPNSEVQPLYFISKKVNPSQSKYNATVLEFFAINTALNFFRPFLLGRKFKVFTDHKPLAGFLSNKNPSSKILRWKLALEEFNYDIHYIRGSLNSVVDHLSLCINNITIALPDSEDLVKMQHEDPVLSPIIQKLDQNDVSPQVSNYFINGEGLLCHLSKRPSRSPRSNTTRKQVCIPHCLKARILESVHAEYGGHLKFFKTFHRLSENFFWQNMYKDTKNFVRSCTVCLSRKNAFKIPPAPHQPVEQSQEPGETCHIDIFVPLKTTPKGNSYVLSMIDAFTKYIHIVPLPDIKSSTISKAFFDNYIVHSGFPHKLVVDNATYFKSSEFVEFCKVMGIHKRHISSYSAHVNGRVEKPNQSLANILASISQNTNDWNEQLPHTMTSSHGCVWCIGSSCITKLTPSRVRSLDVPPCTMSRIPKRFKQHRVATTRPMNCYAVSTRLGRSRHSFFLSLPSGRGQTNVGASRFNEPDGRQGCVLAQTVESNQGGRFDSNESVADSFPSGAAVFKSSCMTIFEAFFPLTSARKTSRREANSLPEVTLRPLLSSPLR